MALTPWHVAFVTSKNVPSAGQMALPLKWQKIQACLRQSLTKNDWQPYIKHDDLISVYVHLSYWFCFFHKYNTRLIVYRHAYMLILFLWVYFIISFISVLFIYRYLLDLFWMCPPKNFTICCTVYDSVCDNNTWFDCDLVFIRFNVQVIYLLIKAKADNECDAIIFCMVLNFNLVIDGGTRWKARHRQSHYASSSGAHGYLYQIS